MNAFRTFQSPAHFRPLTDTEWVGEGSSLYASNNSRIRPALIKQPPFFSMCAKNQPRPTLYFPFSACQLRESKFGRRREAFSETSLSAIIARLLVPFSGGREGRERGRLCVSSWESRERIKLAGGGGLNLWENERWKKQ